MWFAETESALSIPPWSEGAYKVLNKAWHVLQHIPEDGLVATISGMRIAEGSGYTPAELAETVLQRRVGNDADVTMSWVDFRRQEYAALVHGRTEAATDQDFVCIPAPPLSPAAAAFIDQVMLVTRLREVRALKGFGRLLPPGPDQAKVAPLSETSLGWLPAIDVIGEGVFLRINEQRLCEWESSEAVRLRLGRVILNYDHRRSRDSGVGEVAGTPRFLLLHSLAHILINQWALECGYPAASLRERLFVGPDMAGLLLYTASSDSAGSLGGVVALADEGRLSDTLSAAVNGARWCSADPLCIETELSGVDGLNLAACHCCSLLPEVSCEMMNVMLDRALLVGTTDKPQLGFFADLVDLELR